MLMMVSDSHSPAIDCYYLCKKQVFLQQFSEKLISAVFRKGGSAFLAVFLFYVNKG